MRVITLQSFTDTSLREVRIVLSIPQEERFFVLRITALSDITINRVNTSKRTYIGQSYPPSPSVVSLIYRRPTLLLIPMFTGLPQCTWTATILRLTITA